VIGRQLGHLLLPRRCIRRDGFEAVDGQQVFLAPDLLHFGRAAGRQDEYFGSAEEFGDSHGSNPFDARRSLSGRARGNLPTGGNLACYLGRPAWIRTENR